MRVEYPLFHEVTHGRPWPERPCQAHVWSLDQGGLPSVLQIQEALKLPLEGRVSEPMGCDLVTQKVLEHSLGEENWIQTGHPGRIL